MNYAYGAVVQCDGLSCSNNIDPREFVIKRQDGAGPPHLFCSDRCYCLWLEC